MKITVESGIPAPSGRAGYPFASMDVDESFFIECDTFEEAKKYVTSIGTSARNFAKKHEGVKFTTRTITNEKNQIEGVRCWRVE